MIRDANPDRIQGSDHRRQDAELLEAEDEGEWAGQLLDVLAFGVAMGVDPARRRDDYREGLGGPLLVLPDAHHRLGIGGIAAEAVEGVRRVDEDLAGRDLPE